jgi:hypothetical protein
MFDNFCEFAIINPFTTFIMKIYLKTLMNEIE